ncbi:hypothetical protein XENTR_v10003876 [Xenopus tropicalis]|nr:hypothetical protein XENTR_v10003876 [Xenopus tropicalis]
MAACRSSVRIGEGCHWLAEAHARAVVTVARVVQMDLACWKEVRFPQRMNCVSGKGQSKLSCSRMDIEGIRNVISVMQKNLECPICLELMKEPVATKCDHIFCKFCMLQLLSKKKKENVPCPLCKTEVTRRSLQESHRFKLLVEGLLKIIKAFELDSGCKFFPSQENTVSGFESTIKDVLIKEDQPVVHCKGYRNRKKGILKSKTFEVTGTLLESKPEAQFAKLVTRLTSCRQKKHRKEASPIFVNCVPDSSECHLLNNESGSGNDRSPLCEKEDTLNPDMEAMVGSDQAECEFSETAERTGSNLPGSDGPGCITETSAETNVNTAANSNIYAREAEQYLNEHLCRFKQDIADRVHQRNQHCGNVPFVPNLETNFDEEETIETDFDNQYDDSNPQNIDPLCKVAKLMRRSTERVNEWLLKTNEESSTLLAEEDSSFSVFPLQNKEPSEKGSCSSNDLMPVLHKHAEQGTSGSVFDKQAVGVKDKIFCKVYKRQQKSLPPNNITCVVEVHRDSSFGTGTENKTLRMDQLMCKRKIAHGLNPENLAITNGSINIYPDDCISEADVEQDAQSKACSELADADQSELVHCTYTVDGNTPKKRCVESLANALETREEQKKLSCERSQKKKCCTWAVQSVASEPETRLLQSSCGHLDLLLVSSQSIDDPKNVINQVRRSRRLQMLPGLLEKAISNAGFEPKIKNANQQQNGIQSSKFKVKEKNPMSDTVPSQMKKKDMFCLPFTSDDTDTSMNDGSEEGVPMRKGSTRNHDKVHCNDGDCDTLLCVTESDVQPNDKETEESELETQQIVKMFKTSKRTSFILDSRAAEAVAEVTLSSDILQVKASYDVEYRDVSSLGSAKEQSSALTNESSPSSEPKKSSSLPWHKKRKQQAKSKHGKMCRSRRENSKPTDNRAKSPIINMSHSSNTIGQPADLNSPIHGGTGSIYKQVINHCPTRPNIDGEYINASANGSQSSVTDKSPAHFNINTNFICDVNSATPDGLLHSMDNAEGNSSLGDTTVHDEGKNAAHPESFLPSSVHRSVGLTGEKKCIPKVQSSEEGSSGDDLLGSQGLFCQKSKCVSSGATDQKNSKNPGNAQRRNLPDFSGSSNSGKYNSREMLCKAVFPSLSQESQCSVSLFSSLSNMSQQSANEDHKLQGGGLGSPSRTEETTISSDEETLTAAPQDHNQNPDIAEASECESEASHTGDSSLLSSQDELLNTQQRDYMKDSLKKLQQEMAALEAVLEQHGTQNLSAGTACIPSAEHVTYRQEEAVEKEIAQGDNSIVRTPPKPDANGSALIGQSTDNGLQSRNRSMSPAPPHFLSQTRAEKNTQERVGPAMGISKVLKKSLVTEHKLEVRPDLETANVMPANPMDAKESSGQSSENKSENPILRNKCSTSHQGLFSYSMEEAVSPHNPKQSRAEFGIARKSTSPTFASPSRAKVLSVGIKSPVVSSRRNLSFVASGLNQSELAVVQRFSRTTQSILSTRITDSTTHVIMKTDAELVCERTLKYFQGIAGRKWVVSYEWVVQSFKEGQVLDEYDFEVKGDVINGRNHRGPRRSRLGSDGLLLKDFEICFSGLFTDMTLDDLEWMVSECGSTVVRDLQFPKNKLVSII